MAGLIYVMCDRYLLRRVIKELVEAQHSRQARHIPYRDSRLTFLLQVYSQHRTIIRTSPSLIEAGRLCTIAMPASHCTVIRTSPSIIEAVRLCTLGLTATLFRKAHWLVFTVLWSRRIRLEAMPRR